MTIISIQLIQIITPIIIILGIIRISLNIAVIASIDRSDASSSNANRRKLTSHLKLSRWAIIFVLCLFGLIYE